MEGCDMKNGLYGKQEVYLEIAARYEQYIRLGLLQDGEKLPSVRMVAGEMGVNPNTVQRAFRLLEEKGFLSSVPKKGNYVIAPKNFEESSKSTERLTQTIRKIKQNGVSQDELQRIIQEVYSHD